MAIRVLSARSLASTSLATVYSVGSGYTASISNAVLCNNSTARVDVDVYVCTPTVDTLVSRVKLPAGVGKAKIVPTLIGGINSQGSIKLRPSNANSINCVIYGEVTAS